MAQATASCILTVYRRQWTGQHSSSASCILTVYRTQWTGQNSSSGSFAVPRLSYHLPSYRWHCMAYILALGYAQIPSFVKFHFCHKEANKRFFRTMSHPSSCVFSLLLPPRSRYFNGAGRHFRVYLNLYETWQMDGVRKSQ